MFWVGTECYGFEADVDLPVKSQASQPLCYVIFKEKSIDPT